MEITLEAQNLIANYSFEEHIQCPDNEAQINYAVGWENWGATPDLFDSCSISPLSGVPYNFAYGFQYPRSGNAYSGFFGYWTQALSSGSNGTRELVAQHLTKPLSTGSKYFISFYVSLSLWTTTLCPCNHIGVKFTTSSFDAYAGGFSSPLVNNFSHFNEDTLITDSLNWVHLEGSFTADSNYQYIVFGNFYDNGHTDTVLMGPGQLCYSYYYLDDVCLSTDSLGCIATSTSLAFNIDKFEIYPNPFSNQCVLKFPGDLLSITLINNLGQSILPSIRELDSGKSLVIHKGNLPVGMYLLRIQTKQKDFLKRIIIQ